MLMFNIVFRICSEPISFCKKVQIYGKINRETLFGIGISSLQQRCHDNNNIFRVDNPVTVKVLGSQICSDAAAEICNVWFYLFIGDIGYYDKDGYVIISDRLKELIKVKGFQVR